MLGDQRHHDDGQRSGCPGDHAGPSADGRRDEPDNEGRIEPDKRVHASHEGKGHRFRHERQRHGETRQQLGLDPAGRELGEVRLRKILRAKAICKSSE